MRHRRESWLRLVARRTGPLVLALVVGIGCVAALLYVEWPHVPSLLEKDERRALTTPEGQIWLVTLLGQGALWAICGAIVIPELWRRRGWPRGAALVVGGIVIVLLGGIGFALDRFGPQPDYPLVGHSWKLLVMTFFGSLIAFLALILAWAAVGEADRALARIGDVESPGARRAALAAHVTERAGDTTVIEWYMRLRQTLTLSLGVQGTILAAAVLATGARQNALKSVGVSVPFEHTVEYGLVLSAIIGALYFPCHQRLSELGAAIREQLCPPPTAADPDLLKVYDQRNALGKLLQLDITAATAFRAPLAILAPLATGVIAELLK